MPQHQQLYLQCVVRELSGRGSAAAGSAGVRGNAPAGGTPGSAPRQAARAALEHSCRTMLAGELLPSRSAGAVQNPARVVAAGGAAFGGPGTPPQCDPGLIV